MKLYQTPCRYKIVTSEWFRKIKININDHEMQKQKFPHKIQKLRESERIENLEVERVIKLCAQGDGFKNGLDIGTGSGLFTEAFLSQVPFIAGIDNDPEMIQAARVLVPHGFFVSASAEAIPFSANSFDIVFFGLVLHEIDDPLKALQEARRVAKQRVAVLEWPYPSRAEKPPLTRRFMPGEVRQLSQNVGFHHIDTFQLKRFLLYRMDM